MTELDRAVWLLAARRAKPRLYSPAATQRSPRHRFPGVTLLAVFRELSRQNRQPWYRSER